MALLAAAKVLRLGFVGKSAVTQRQHRLSSVLSTVKLLLDVKAQQCAYLGLNVHIRERLVL